jgi:hypothetical protein
MKKLFTLMAVTLLSLFGSVTVSAQEEVDITARFSYCWGGDEESVTANDDGTLTYKSKAWGGMAAWIGGEDWSMYGTLTFEFAEPVPVSGQINFMAESGNPCQWFNAGSTSVTMTFGETDLTKVNQIALQAADVATIQIKRVYLTTAIKYEEKASASIPVTGKQNEFFPAGLFAGFSQNAKVVFTVDVAGSADFPGWGIGEVITPHLTKNENWQVVEGIMVFEVKGGTDGQFTYSKTIKELLPALTQWPDDNTGEYGIVSNMYGQGGGTCTATLKSIEIFEEAGVEAQDVSFVAIDGEDLTKLLFNAANGVKLGNLTIELDPSATVMTSAPIRIPANLTVIGNGATIDASNLEVPLFQLAPVTETAAAAAPAHRAAPAELPEDAKYIEEISFNGLNVKGLKYQFIYGNKAKVLIGKLSVDNCVIAVDGSKKKTIFDFNGGGNAEEIIINNSTIWANPSNAQNGGLFSSQSGHGSIQDLKAEKQLFAITNSTIYNIASGKSTNSQRRNNTVGMEYQVENSIIVNSGKSGQFIVGLNGGSANANQTYTINNNVLNFDNADVSADEQAKVQEKVDLALNSVAGVVKFAKADEGDFNGEFAYGAGATEPTTKPGDPRWTIVWSSEAPAVEEINVAKALEIIAALADGAKTDAEYQVKGIVVGAPDFQRKADGSLYGNVNLTIADEKGGATTLTVFRGKSYENKNFDEETISLIKENDEVVFQGKLQKYVKDETTTPELVNGWLISVVPAPVVDDALFSWEGGAEGAKVSGGTVVGNGADAESINYANGDYYTIRLSSKKANIDTDNVTITLNEALKGGEEIALYAYINKNESKQSSAFFKFENGTELEGEVFGDEENIGMTGAPATKKSVVPAEAAGSKVIKMARSKTQTNLFIIKMTITSGGTTGISTVQTIKVDNEAVYNLAGQKVDANYKGVVIKGGKKFFQK